MSAIFQRPLCEMGAAYDFAFRPSIGDAEGGMGGGCDDRPHPVELFGAASDPKAPSDSRRSFALCPEHEAQLRAQDARLRGEGKASRFAPPHGASAPAPGGPRP